MNSRVLYTNFDYQMNKVANELGLMLVSDRFSSFLDRTSTEKRLGIGLTIVFVTPLLLFGTLILYRVIRAHKICRENDCSIKGSLFDVPLYSVDKLDRFDASANGTNNGPTGSNSLFSNWINQQKGFRRLAQEMEEERDDDTVSVASQQ